ncbi:natriuretic peptides A-like [Elgaria multicarinata webbii]|uniref:natriuretic peptides A-like n=1 Tax=Elgaria multicarinata webbii TaxID=159646 RepID=UPI002FCD123D
MDAMALPCWSPLVFVFLQAGLGSPHAVTWSPSGQELQSLQDLLERLKEKFQQGEMDAADYGAAEAGDSSYFDLADLEGDRSSQLRSQEPRHQAEVEDQLRKFLASPKRRRYFSGCFGTRLERIGTQTGLGCNIYKARRSL